MGEALLEVRDLSVSFCQYEKGWQQVNKQVIHKLSLNVRAGEIMAVVGASGSGKSLLAHAILGILPVNCSYAGELIYEGETLDEARIRALRGSEIALVPQSVTYLDPLMKAGRQAALASSKSRIRELFQAFGLEDRVMNLYPYQLSGGMARRVLVSTALANRPRLLIADEPTPGLDQAGVAETMRSFAELRDQGHAIIMITHDLEAALTVADRIAVFYQGTTVEIAQAGDFSGQGEGLRHPYSQDLWLALPQNAFQIPARPGKKEALKKRDAEINGTNSCQAKSLALSVCPYLDFCPKRTEECGQSLPELSELRGGRVRCIHAD